MLLMNRSAAGLQVLAATLFCTVSCGGSEAHHHLEVPETVESDDQPLDSEVEESKAGAVAIHPDDSRSDAVDDDRVADPAPQPAPPQNFEPKEAAIARAALQRVVEANNQLGLVLTVAERTSDLPWILALENRSPHDIKLAALPSLIRFEITTPAAQGSSETLPAPKSELCETSVPKSIDEKETVVLPAGEILIHAFDPRTMCETEQSFVNGATVKLSYGFPIATKKLWKNGKMTEVEVEQKAPFLAERMPNGTEVIAGIKQLIAEPFSLGRTYPLSKLNARASTADEAKNGAASNEMDNVELEESDPVEVKIFPLGTTSSPENGLVRVQVQNISDKSLLIYLRRESFSYEVAGPAGSTSCQMLPRELAASNQSYTSLAPAGVVNLSTRLAEACPPNTFEMPGKYTVAVNFSPTSSGEEKKENALVGNITGSNVATLTVPGNKTAPRAYMRVVSAQAH